MEMQTFSQREQEILKRSVEVLEKYINPNKILLFGSRGKGRFHEYSDFDLAIDSERPDIRIERKISEEIDEVSGLYKVDIVYLKSAEEGFRDIIIKTGRVIYERRS